MLTIQVYNTSVATGNIKGHRRDDGWAVLVKRVAEEHIAATAPDFHKACGFLRDRDGAVCVKPRNHLRKCKFVVVRPVRRKR